ncbi:GNAT family N-acetyltransferase [Lysinibacillus sphaericus]|uniref:GNAT family N-acetyltransferase n=1 Tax=Lysinibacillus sphaericus TaxID=1421 RepID=UPI0025A285EA|nr:GNAT family N-acetyltransferase [Lysinibacillus sphaericus]MDM5351818.1 GNAT family N-acetyltransferase [Lysinibacillus sphaericus]
MRKIFIRRPEQTDTPALHQFFLHVIQDTFAKEGLAELVDDQQHEWATKKQYLAADFDSQGQKRFFWLVEDADTKEIVGTIEYGESNEFIQKMIKEDLSNCPEIGTVYVHPSYQGRGIGTMLVNKMLTTLEMKIVPSFCLDSGYKQAQLVWQKKFGQPNYVLEHFWGTNNHHMIWKRNLPFQLKE